MQVMQRRTFYGILGIALLVFSNVVSADESESDIIEEDLKTTMSLIRQNSTTLEEKQFLLRTLNKYAETGIQAAIYQLGLLFSTDRHFKPDIEYANYLLRANYEAGHIFSGGFLAINFLNEYMREEENTQLLEDAIALLESLSHLEELVFQRYLYQAYFTKGAVVEGEKVLRWCAEQGDLQSVLELADFLMLKSEIDAAAVEEAKILYEFLLESNFDVQSIQKRLERIQEIK